VLDVPRGSVPRGGQWAFVEILEEKRFPVDDGAGPWPADGRSKTPTYH
jgi:hypothetical protein